MTMTMTGTRPSTAVEYYRARFRDISHDRPELREMGNRFVSLEHFLTVAGTVRVVNREHLDYEARRLAMHVADAGRQVDRDVRVVRVSYASPLDIIIAISLGSSALTGIGYQAMSLYQKYLESVGMASTTKTALAREELNQTAYSVIKSSLKLPGGVTDTQVLGSHRFNSDGIDAQVRYQLNGAIEALTELESFEEVPEDEVP